ncbi:ADP-ribosylarginine hydrolase CG2909 isoform X1 [Leptinotarsa decemlineata]|uniref:ADP-ribosylarginine hydrolase CG2909 isoform X1 n=1 Tax=Leptinotarsa decemlineata TaxID=7539 RepID=UPI003D305A34
MTSSEWSPKSPEWSSETFSILIYCTIDKIPKVTLSDIVAKSEDFPIQFPVDSGRCKTLKNVLTEEILERNINSVYPVIHENALELYCKFILFKRKYGTTKEKSLFKDMTLKNFINRLLVKRAVNFMGPTDKFLLLNKQSGAKNWELIGTDKESPPLIIEQCISYDEIKLAVFLSVSSYTYCLNKGDRKNFAKRADNRDNIADEGVIIGVIGPRLKKKEVMEYQEIVASKKQNTKQNGYGTNVNTSVHKLFSEFYEEACLDYEETLKLKNRDNVRYTVLGDGSIFDNNYYYKRLTISIDTLLVEANHRARAVGKTAFIHVVGLGLGVWRISPHQEKEFMEAFAKRIVALGQKLHSVSDICFSYINQEKCGCYKHGDIFNIGGHPLRGVKIHISKRNPHEKVSQEKLLVVSYAWDGNALPGNEYWIGKLGSSGDSAAASSTQIAEIHNPHINPLVCADELRIIKDGQVVTFEEYQNLIRNTKSKRKI